MSKAGAEQTARGDLANGREARPQGGMTAAEYQAYLATMNQGKK